MVKCSKITWSEELSVNEGRIDLQHKEIFEIINSFIFEMDLNSKSTHLAELLSKLTDYSLVHFREEERFMRQNNYPELAAHKRAHNYYIKKVALFNHNYTDLKPTDPQMVCDFLVKWWLDHIMELDFRYKLHIENLKK
ncbi:MAG: bacteriohemerythrin [Bacteroidales bacterium]|jgi:hemerythrin|nr:bacteriohemerythrin [Bacteroidales bacterium]MDD3273542.1 bacteriohemerythrin [Bacteroidales bacterium]MDD4057504.1 bacteriohemerythrin [Bacteroidales bacterium]